MRTVTYAEKNEGARFVVICDGFERDRKVWRIWDRITKNKLPGKYTAKRTAQNEIDEMGKNED